MKETHVFLSFIAPNIWPMACYLSNCHPSRHHCNNPQRPLCTQLTKQDNVGLDHEVELTNLLPWSRYVLDSTHLYCKTISCHYFYIWGKYWYHLMQIYISINKTSTNVGASSNMRLSTECSMELQDVAESRNLLWFPLLLLLLLLLRGKPPPPVALLYCLYPVSVRPPSGAHLYRDILWGFQDKINLSELSKVKQEIFTKLIEKYLIITISERVRKPVI